MLNSKLKSPKQGNESNTMDSFQDGGQQNMNSEHSHQNDYPPNLDGPHVNSDFNNFSQGAGDQGIGNENFSQMNESLPNAQIQGYNPGFNRGNFGMGDQPQHGGMVGTGAGNGDFSSQNSQYNQYGGQNMRPGYQASPRPSTLSGRPVMGSPGMNMPPNYNAGQQRFMSGQSISQQGGPTPTLNQLLTNSNTGQRFQGGYGGYGMDQQKDTGEMTGNPPYNTQNWGPQQRGMTPYQHQMGPNQPYRHQVYTIFLHLLIHLPVVLVKCCLDSLQVLSIPY